MLWTSPASWSTSPWWTRRRGTAGAGRNRRFQRLWWLEEVSRGTSVLGRAGRSWLRGGDEQRQLARMSRPVGVSDGGGERWKLLCGLGLRRGTGWGDARDHGGAGRHYGSGRQGRWWLDGGRGKWRRAAVCGTAEGRGRRGEPGSSLFAGLRRAVWRASSEGGLFIGDATGMRPWPRRTRLQRDARRGGGARYG